jgi:MGT family glycosyltransferase
MARIAMPHIGLGGHLGPAARLGAVLVRQGHEVMAWAPERYREQIEATGARFIEHEPLATRVPWGSLVHFAADLARATERCCGELIEQLLDEQVDLVVHDCHVPWARVASDFLGLPRIVSNPLFPRPRPVASNRRGHAGMGPFAQPLRAIAQSRDEIGRRWGVELGGLEATMCSTGPTVAFTTERILGRQRLPEGFHCVGPLIDRTPRGPGRARPLVYVAFGTFFSTRREPFRAAVEALAGEPVDVLVSTGGIAVSPRDLEPLPPNVSAHEFVDSRAVLAQASLHVTHGGCSSVHESLLAGVPMVCVPQGSDQHDWASRVSELGAGRIVGSDPEALRDAALAMLEDDRPRERARELGDHLSSYDGERRIAALLARSSRIAV